MTATTNPKMILPVGNTGCGKTLLSRRFVLNGAVRVCNDDLLAMAHHTSTCYVKELREVYHQAEDDMILGALTRGFDVYIDRTNIDAATRARFIDLANHVSKKREHHKLGPPVDVIVYDFGEGVRGDVMRRGRNARGKPFEQWQAVHEAIRARYEAPELGEGIDEIVEVDNTRFKFFAFDFDGVIAGNAFPEIGEVDERVVGIMRRLWLNPHCYLIVYTCREDTVTGDIEALGFRLDKLTPHLSNAIAFMREHKIPHDMINHNTWFGPSGRKMFAHVYVDDRNLTLDGVEDLMTEGSG
jgi:hypothetical protein